MCSSSISTTSSYLPTIRRTLLSIALCGILSTSGCDASARHGGGGGGLSATESQSMQPASAGSARITVNGDPIPGLDTSTVECNQETPGRVRIVMGKPSETRIGLSIENPNSSSNDGYDSYGGALVGISPSLNKLAFADDPRRQIDGGSFAYAYDSGSATFGFTGLVQWSNAEGLGLMDGNYEVSAVCPGLSIPVLTKH